MIFSLKAFFSLMEATHIEMEVNNQLMAQITKILQM